MQDNQKKIALIITNSPGFPPVVFHRAIKFYPDGITPYIIHRTRTGVEILHYDTFMQKRHILHQESIPLIEEFDAIRIRNKYNTKFDWLNNNCEDFTSEVIEEKCGRKSKIASPQRFAWISLLAIILITLVLLR